MTTTISKHLGEGFSRGELYAALAHDTNDQFGGYEIKSICLNFTTYEAESARVCFANRSMYIAPYTSTELDIVADDAVWIFSDEIYFMGNTHFWGGEEHTEGEGTITVEDPTEGVNAVYGYIDAGVGWTTTENLVGVRGKVDISTTATAGDATGVWAGIDITGNFTRAGLVCGLNVEVQSAVAASPNAIVYIQSLPKAGADFSAVPYIAFTELEGGTGSNLLFSLGHQPAGSGRNVTSGTSGDLLYNETIRIEANGSIRYIPLSTEEGTYTTAYPIVSSAQIKTTLSTGVAMYVNSTATAAGSYGMYSLINGTYDSGGCWAVYGDITWAHATSGYPTMYGVCGRATVNDNYTGGTGYVYAVSGELHFTNDTIINNGSSVFAALCGVITSDASPTFTTGHITCLYLDNLCNDTDLADTAGVNSFIYMANNSGGKDLDDAIYLYGPDVSNFIRFQGCTSIVSSTYTTPLHGTACVKIKISIDGTAYYLLASTTISD